MTTTERLFLHRRTTLSPRRPRRRRRTGSSGSTRSTRRRISWPSSCQSCSAASRPRTLRRRWSPDPAPPSCPSTPSPGSPTLWSHPVSQPSLLSPLWGHAWIQTGIRIQGNCFRQFPTSRASDISGTLPVQLCKYITISIELAGNWTYLQIRSVLSVLLLFEFCGDGIHKYCITAICWTVPLPNYSSMAMLCVIELYHVW